MPEELTMKGLILFARIMSPFAYAVTDPESQYVHI
jgi:hypothetical protein